MLASVLSFFWYRRYLRSGQLLQDEMKRRSWWHWGIWRQALPTNCNPLSSIKGLAKYFAERAPAGEKRINWRR
ncbi:hypothetical protein DMH88_05915 [Escherichia coli]|nr:hypothetical protein [Escherichia coli]